MICDNLRLLAHLVRRATRSRGKDHDLAGMATVGALSARTRRSHPWRPHRTTPSAARLSRYGMLHPMQRRCAGSVRSYFRS